MAYAISIFWPVRKNSSAGVIGRFGRLIHWTALVLAALIIGLGATGKAGDLGNVAILDSVAVAIGFLGRGLRYVLAAE